MFDLNLFFKILKSDKLNSFQSARNDKKALTTDVNTVNPFTRNVPERRNQADKTNDTNSKKQFHWNFPPFNWAACCDTRRWINTEGDVYEVESKTVHNQAINKLNFS